VAAADGVITGDEQQDLQTVAELLGLDHGGVAQALRVAHHALSLAGNRSGHRRWPGAQVLIEGGSRTTWERAAASGEPMFVVIDGTWPLPTRP
jgi:hypothetical protein